MSHLRGVGFSVSLAPVVDGFLIQEMIADMDNAAPGLAIQRVDMLVDRASPWTLRALVRTPEVRNHIRRHVGPFNFLECASEDAG